MSLRSMTACLSVLAMLCLSQTAGAQAVRTIEEYNNSLIANGISWKAKGTIYYPSFYTGFAPRVEDASRTHFHLARGNQARLTTVLDEMTVLTYLYNLKKRSDIYTSMIQNREIVPVHHQLVDSFRSIVASDSYQILPTVNAYNAGQMSREQLYETSLKTLRALNPGRVFDIRINLRERALAWRDSTLRAIATNSAQTTVPLIKTYLTKESKAAIVAANSLLFGRVNATYLNDEQLTQLASLIAQASVSVTSDDEFVTGAVAFLKSVTLGRYDFRVVVNGQYRPAIQCSTPSQCDLAYSELTAIYPNGSVRATVADRDGNRIPMIRENGVMKFVERGYHDVDHIRSEPYYGYIPKMDYTYSGNGIHNPAVRTYLPSSKYSWLHGQLGIPKSDNTLWIVARGEVSHGCTRIGAGHMHEIREIFPSNPREMTKLYYSGNASTDYDLFDVDGNGQLEVMGVDYLIAYAIVSDHGEGYREGNGLITASFKKDQFYGYIYGQRQYFFDGSRYVFQNPYMSYFSGKPSDERAKAFSVKMEGNFPLYEQAYEKDKIQFFDIPSTGVSSLSGNKNNHSNRGAQIVRLMGRVNGCGPFAREFARCNESRFDAELKSLFSGRR